MTADSDPIEGEPSTPDASPDARRSARGQLLPVAVTLLVMSTLHIFGGLFYFVFIYSKWADPVGDPVDNHLATVYFMYYGISMLYCLLLASGALSMMRQ